MSCNKDWSFVGSFFGFVGQERFTVKGFDFVDDGGDEVYSISTVDQIVRKFLQPIRKPTLQGANPFYSERTAVDNGAEDVFWVVGRRWKIKS